MGKTEPVSDRISIAMLTHNNYTKTHECIDTIIKVLDDDLFYEFLILDNNSQDATRDLVQSLSGKNKIKIILSDTNLGVCAGRNRLFGLARAEIIASIDSDVELRDVNYFYKAARVLNHVPYVGLCGMSAYHAAFIDRKLSLSPCEKEGYADCVSGCCQIFWRYLLDDIRLDERFSPFWCEDTDFCFQIKKIEKQVYYLPGEYGLYHDYRSKTDRKFDKDKQIKERYLVEKWHGNVILSQSTEIEPPQETIDLPGLWIFETDTNGVTIDGDGQKVGSLFGDGWYPQCHVLKQENRSTYLQELPRKQADNLIYIQLLLLFKCGGVCISDHYLHRENLFKSLFHRMADQNLDLILFRYRNQIRNDVIIARKGSTLLHKCLLFGKIDRFADLVPEFGERCRVLDHCIGDADGFNSAGAKLIRLSGNEDPTKLKHLKISTGHRRNGRIRIFDMPPYTMNPCIIRCRDEYCLIARQESKYKNSLNSRSKNVLYFLDRVLKICKRVDLTLVLGRKKFIDRNRYNLSDRDFIIEDIRFITHTEFQDHKIPVFGSAMVDFENEYITRIALLELNVKEHTLTFIKFLEINAGEKVEKNWEIFLGKGYYYIIYKIDPLEIYRCKMDFSDIRLHHRHDHKIAKRYVLPHYAIRDDLLHLSAVVDFDRRYYLISFRFFTYDHNYSGQMTRIYSHFGVLMNKRTYHLDYIIEKDIMSCFSYNVIINNSSLRIGGEIYFFCGFNDAQSGYIQYSVDELQHQITRIKKYF